MAAHTDSPCLRVKPISKRRSKEGFLQVAVETYGGGLWHTWFDRDLGVAGRLVIKEEDALVERLVHVKRPILRVPTLAIHLDRCVNSEGFRFNTELQLTPILATEAAESKSSEWVHAVKNEGDFPMHSSLITALKGEIKAEVGDIVALDLCLYDVQKAALGGVHEEFIHSARLDNLFMSFCGLSALVEATTDVQLVRKDEHISMLVLFDNEEVGSQSAAGAESTLVSSTLSRILNALNCQVAFFILFHHYQLVLGCV